MTIPPHKLNGIQHCPFCVTQFARSLMIDGKCPNCHIELITPIKPTEEKNLNTIAIRGVNKSDSFVTKCYKLVKLFPILGMEIGHGFCVFEFRWSVDTTKLDNHLRTYLYSVYKGWKITQQEKFLCVIDTNYDKKTPDTRLPKIKLPDPKPSDGDKSVIQLPGPQEEEEQPNDGNDAKRS